MGFSDAYPCISRDHCTLDFGHSLKARRLEDLAVLNVTREDRLQVLPEHYQIFYSLTKVGLAGFGVGVEQQSESFFSERSSLCSPCRASSIAGNIQARCVTAKLL